MKLISLKIEERFRSLPQNFEIKFQPQIDQTAMSDFRPYCLVGLNGCGKSNVLEALAHIFYHLELCVSVNLPSQIQASEIFSRTGGKIVSYHLEYYWHDSGNSSYDTADIVKVTIDKRKNKEPQMFVYSFKENVNRLVSLNPSVNNDMVAEGKKYLPQYIVAYSSGENETLSIPFIKSRLLHLDEFREYTSRDYEGFPTAENGMIYIDANMSQAILLCCLLFEDEQTLSNLRDYDTTGILGIKQFRMCLREHDFISSYSGENHQFSYFKLLWNNCFEKFRKCATMTWRDTSQNQSVLYYDFWVNDATKMAFKQHFKSAIECFQNFRLLYELNYYKVGIQKEKEIFNSKGIYTEDKFTLPGPEDDTFHFLDFFITKQITKSGETKNILLKGFSDGEHQFIHTMSICLLLKDSDSLILLDEPETHFNPNWRSRFISMLNNSLRNGCLKSKSDVPTCNFLKEVLITSHSPFIISDCLPNHVIILNKTENGCTLAETAIEADIQTYGTSVNVLTASIFGNDDSIGHRAYEEMIQIKDNTTDKSRAIAEINKRFGESLDKLIVINQLKE